MTIASARSCAALSALLPLYFACPQARASDRVETAASVTIVRSAAVTVVPSAAAVVANNASLHVQLLIAAIAPVGVVFSASGVGRFWAGAAGGGVTEGGGMIAFGGALSGTTIEGDAVSVSVGDLSGGSTPDSATVPMVIAQYN